MGVLYLLRCQGSRVSRSNHAYRTTALNVSDLTRPRPPRPCGAAVSAPSTPPWSGAERVPLIRVPGSPVSLVVAVALARCPPSPARRPALVGAERTTTSCPSCGRRIAAHTFPVAEGLNNLATRDLRNRPEALCRGWWLHCPWCVSRWCSGIFSPRVLSCDPGTERRG